MSGPTIADIVTLWRGYNELGINAPNHGKSGYLEFDKQVLKSYRTPIACYHPPRFASNKNGYVLLLNQAENTPWGTMSNHLGKASRAVTWEKLRVPHVGTAWGLPGSSALAGAHEGNGKWFVDRLHTLADGCIKQFRVRDDHEWGSMSKVMQWIAHSYSEIERYMAVTGAEIELPPLDEIISRVAEEREKLWVKWLDPKAVVRRERAAARKAAILALNLGD
jgi:hypothetical protein